MAWSRGWPTLEPWVSCYQSGPLGGDAQIAEQVDVEATDTEGLDLVPEPF